MTGFLLGAKHPSLYSLAQALFGAHDFDCNGLLTGIEVRSLLEDLFKPQVRIKII